MPKVVKLYNKSKGSLKHNQGPVGPKLPSIPRPGGLQTCTANANAAFAAGKIDAVELAKRIAACRAKFVTATGG